jgi:hypothetical protein
MGQDELEGIAERCGWGQGNTWDDCMCCSTFDLEAFTKLVEERTVAKEREACAKVCEWYSVSKRANINYSEECAEAIRARGETTLRGTKA